MFSTRHIALGRNIQKIVVDIEDFTRNYKPESYTAYCAGYEDPAASKPDQAYAKYYSMYSVRRIAAVHGDTSLRGENTYVGLVAPPQKTMRPPQNFSNLQQAGTISPRNTAAWRSPEREKPPASAL